MFKNLRDIVKILWMFIVGFSNPPQIIAHDTDLLFVGVEAKDDFVISDNQDSMFWKDDAIEIVADANNDRVFKNSDNSNDLYGGHHNVNNEGRFSRWDDDSEEQIFGVWTTDLDWTYGDGADDDVFGVGGVVEGGWNMEDRVSKRQFEDPDGAGPIEIGDRMGFQHWHGRRWRGRLSGR